MVTTTQGARMTIVFSGGNSRSPNDSRILSVDINPIRSVQDEVKLCGRDLVTIPEYVRRNVHLRILDLSNNNLGRSKDNVISDLSELKNLTRLNLSINELKTVPLDFVLFPFLEVLCLSGNELEYLPDGVTSLHRLKRFHCDFNHIRSLPQDWSSLVSLTSLTVSNNHLEKIPSTIWNLQCLEILNLQRNRISFLDPLPDGAASRLKELRLAWNRLSGSLDLSQLVKPFFNFFLNLDHKAKSLKPKIPNLILSHIPAEIFSCCNLMDLRLNHNFLVKLPDFLTQCHMKSLSLQYNKFEKLPYNFFWALPCLEMLNLSYNSLKSLPVSCDSVINLKTLLLSGNELNDLTNLVNLLKLSRIECLHLAYNKIKELPDGFFQALHFLRTLSLSGNDLESIPSQIAKAHNLEKLYLHSNQLASIPKFSESDNLQVLDLACNKVHQLELASIVAKDLTYLDLSANFELKIDPTDFQHLCIFSEIQGNISSTTMSMGNKGVLFKIDWKIKNFEDFPARKGQLLSSPTFVIESLHNSKWILHLYPDGDSDGNGKCTALYLVRKSDDDYPDDIVLDCELSFVTSERLLPVPWSMPPISWKTTEHTFQRGGRCGSQEFLAREKILMYLEHDTLTVRCVVFQNDGNPFRSGGCVAVSLVGTDQRSFEWIIEDFPDLKPGDKKVMSVKSASKDEYSMNMTLSMISERLMVDVSPIDGKRIKRAYCSLYAKDGSESFFCGSDSTWLNETKVEQKWSFPLWCSKEDLLDKLINNSLHLVCNFKFHLGVEFGKIENTYFRPVSDPKNELCSIM
ncbi:PH domain leucine-rich repeat-containing [Argiope bruennichi]|uniref:PH domain leucine-rich repeat-containing n=1 Tax=Argiope bruennichi TaxID=94029 RepID=A0A8T0EHF9_ARGBR|nr:PH domain leucine-rich repeat-containing [Argiope bruennichi]